jgi:hypothetical protein
VCGPLLVVSEIGHTQGARSIDVPDVPAGESCVIRVVKTTVPSRAHIDAEINALPFAVRVDPTGRFWVLTENTLPRICTPKS